MGPLLALVSWWRVGAVIAIAVALASSHWWAYTSGRDQVKLRWDADVSRRIADALAAERQARATEQALAEKARKVANDYNAEKHRRAAADTAAADSLRRLNAALAAGDRATTRDSAATPGADDDPRSGIIAECAAALGQLDRAYRALAGQTRALQGYASSVCVGESQH